MVKPMATQPRRAASFTLPVTAEQGGWPFDSVSLSLSFKMSGIWPAYFPATASRKPSGAAYALQPASMASWMWYSGSYPAGLGAKERAGPCSKPWSTGRMTIFPEPASRPWLSRRAMLVLVPGLSEGYQLRISRTRAVNSMSASRNRSAARLPAARRKVQETPCPPCREPGGRTAPRREGAGAGRWGRADRWPDFLFHAELAERAEVSWLTESYAGERSEIEPKPLRPLRALRETVIVARVARGSGGDGVGFDLDQHGGVDERLDLDHGGGGRAGGEEFAVGAPVLLPAGDVGHEHAGAHDAGPVGAELAQGALDQLQAAARLRVSVAGRVHALAGVVHRGGARHVDVLAGAQRAAVADLRLPRCFRERALEVHRLTSGTGPPRRRARRSSRGCGIPASAPAALHAPRRARAASPASSPASPWRATPAAAPARRARRPGRDPAPGASTRAPESDRRAAGRERQRRPAHPPDTGAAGPRAAAPGARRRGPGPRRRRRAPRSPSGPGAGASPRRWTRASGPARR